MNWLNNGLVLYIEYIKNHRNTQDLIDYNSRFTNTYYPDYKLNTIDNIDIELNIHNQEVHNVFSQNIYE